MDLIEENKTLLNSLPNLTGDMARLAHRLAETTNRLVFVKEYLRLAGEGKTVVFHREDLKLLLAGLNSVCPVNFRADLEPSEDAEERS